MIRRPRGTRRRRMLGAEALEARRVLAAAIDSTVWLDVADDFVAGDQVEIRATSYDLYQLDRTTLQSLAVQAPLQHASDAATQPTIAIPLPNGGFQSFRFGAAPIMAPELAAQFPEITTYAGQGLDDPAATLRFDVTPAGFHAQVLSPRGSFYIDPVQRGSDFYASYFASGNFDVSDLHGLVDEQLFDDAAARGGAAPAAGSSAGDGNRLAGRSGTELRTYRTAVAATGEYTIFHGGTVAAGQAAIVTAMNRVTGIYENELSIAFELVANNSSLVFTDPNADPFSNNNGVAMLGENQTLIDARIGNANYDIGHVFSTGGGGVARLGSVGVDGIKAQGVTGLPAPTNDAFYVDYVSHEIGHQFGGNHTFNGDSGACQGNVNPSTAMEPGSGSTIQAYAGICDNDDLQTNSDPYFHSVSFDEMIAHVDQVIPNVGMRRPTGNSVPIVSAGADHVIPANTAFVLTALGTDANPGQQLTYNWEQRDVGPPQDVNGGDNGRSPIFRSWNPTLEPARYFPRLVDLVRNTTTVGETIPTSNRLLNFRVSIRDNNVGGGGVNSDDVQLQVVDTGAPFRVLEPNTAVTWEGLSQQTITWDVAGTAVAPISSPDVAIYFSTDGGLTYPFVIADRLPNVGTADVFIPNVDTTAGRVMVRGADNVFFDISDVDLTVNAIPIDVQLDAGAAVYTENSPAISVSPGALVNSSGNLSGLSIDVSISQGQETGDALSILSTAGISMAGGVLLYNGLDIGTIALAGGTVSVRLNANATAAATQAFVRSVSFENATDSPSGQTRNVEFVFGSTIVQSRQVNVIPINDSPVVSNADIPPILEDSLIPVGGRISAFMAGRVTDPDQGSSLAGLVIINNPQSSEGTWYYSDNGNQWLPVGSVNDTNESLVLRSTAFLGFRPQPNYFGRPAALQVRALDNTYTGGFSSASSASPVYLDAASRVMDGPLSANVGEVHIEVQNVNDAPVANETLIPISVLQDQPIDRVFETSLFSDIDSPTLSYSLVSANGGPLPSWLSFNPSTRMLMGTPQNRDVGNYSLLLVGTDSNNASAQIPVVITVVNVNDPPINLKFTGGAVQENRSNVVLGELFASDPDPDDLVFWSTSDPRFIVRDNALILTTSLNYELEQSVQLVLTASDTGLASTQLAVNLKVEDENEFFPQLSGETFSVTEGTPAGTVLRTLNAPDSDIFQTVRYRLKSGDTAAFQLDAINGTLSLAENAGASVADSYLIFIEAYDNGKPTKALTSQFKINVLPVNKFPPTIPPGQSFNFPENLPSGARVGQVSALDLDGEPLVYQIAAEVPGQEGWLVLDSSTGELRTTALADYDFETPLEHSIQVSVTESMAPFRTAVGSVTIQITNVNDPPTAISDYTIPTSQMGYPTTSGFTVVDQDPASGYSLATADPRFEVRAGQLALKPDFYFDDQLAGTTTQLIVTLTDLDDSSTTQLPLQVKIAANPSPWQNPILNFDVNRVGGVTASDVLAVVNAINLSNGQDRILSRPRTLAEYSLPDIDVNGDNILTALDALLVVNYVNANPSGEGEAPSASPVVDSSQIWLAAFRALEEETRRRKD